MLGLLNICQMIFLDLPLMSKSEKNDSDRQKYNYRH